MKKFLLAAMALAVLMPVAAEAQQRKNPPYDLWCRDQGLGRGGGSVQMCYAYTFEQCMASRTSQNERCYLNPRYDPRFRRG
jgi:hypothetical protein